MVDTGTFGMVVRALWLLALCYLLGAIPFGYLMVKARTGRDVRFIESGRTGATNTFRAAGFGPGLVTAILDVLKGASAVWLAKLVFPDVPLMHALAPVVAILGHNYSLYTLDRTPEGKLRLWGGAGGAPCVGGAMGLWWPSLFILVPLGAVIWFFVGYASVATLSMSLLAALLMAILAWMGDVPWVYVVYGLLSEIIILWALRPNIRRLMNGTERVVGLRAWLRKRAQRQAQSHQMSSPGSSSL